MKRRHFSSHFLTFAIISSSLACSTPPAKEVVSPLIVDVQSILPPEAVWIQGHLGQQIDLCISNRIEAQNIEDLLQPFRERKDTSEWRDEFWGKWITSAIEAYRYTGSPKLRRIIDSAVTGLLSTQTPDGYIGSHLNANKARWPWDIWGRKYTILGLLAWYDETGDEKILDAACRHADFLLELVGPGKASPFDADRWQGLASSSVLEPMANLYLRTGRPEYLQFCEYLVNLWPDPNGPDILHKALADVPVFEMFPGPMRVMKRYDDGGKSKAYEMMSCFEGLTELYRITGNPVYGEAVRKIHDNINKSEITIIGSGSDWERWCDGHRRQTIPWHLGMETCVTVTWIKLCFQLLRLTGDSRYADDIELATYNALLGAQGPDGTWWTGESPLAGTKEKAPEQCKVHMNCCVANGPRALLLLPQIAVTTEMNGPVINLYGQINTDAVLTSGSHVHIEENSDYPQSGTVLIRLKPDKPESFTLKLRIPSWSEKTTLTVNGRAAKVLPGTYVSVKRTWQSGDEIILTLDVRPRLVYAPADPSHVAVTRGPVVLARDQRLESGDIDAAVSLESNRGGIVKAVSSTGTHPKDIWMLYSIPQTGKQAAPIPMCDFASAGKTWAADSKYRVWMPLNEALLGQHN